jgi:multiple sugar transport system substrate-binding protein
MKRNSLVWVGLVIVFATVLAACVPPPAAPPAAQAPTAEQPAAEQPTAAPAAPAAPVELTYWLAGGASTDKIDARMQEVQQQCEQSANVKVQVEIVPFPEYDQKSLTALQAQEAPELLQINSVSLGQFTSKGLVSPLDDLIAGSQIVEGRWQSGIYQGKMWGLPLDTGTRIVIYNKDLFKQAGIAEFGDEVTWPELLAAAQKCTNKDQGVYGWSYAAGERWVNLYENFGHFAIQNEARFLSDDMTKVLVNSPEMLEAFKFVKEIAQYAPPDAVNWNAQSIYEQLFTEGKVCMYIGGHWSMDAVLALKPDMPYGLSKPKGKIAGSTTGGWLVSMPAYLTGEKRDAAWKFMECLFTPEHNAKWTTIMPYQPKAAELTMQDPRYRLFKEELPNSRHPIPLHPKLPEMADALQVEGQKFLLDQQTAEETLQKLQTKFEELLK